ncbi:MAG: hypothetical protein AB7S77_24280, partial [Desulfatirhabdiaceae bacterium]
LLLMDVNIIGFFRRVQTYFQRTDNTESITPLYILPLNGIAPIDMVMATKQITFRSAVDYLSDIKSIKSIELFKSI